MIDSLSLSLNIFCCFYSVQVTLYLKNMMSRGSQQVTMSTCNQE